MNKLTKFRIWSLEMKKFIFHPDNSNDIEQYIHVNINGYGRAYHACEYKPTWIVQYFTGLKDKKRYRCI